MFPATRLTKFLYEAVLLLTPLIVVPFASELFEFNKMLFVIFISILVTFTFVYFGLSQRKVVIGRTVWEIPLLIFLFSQILSTVFSIDRHASIWGYYSRFHGGLISTFAYLLLYFGLVGFLATSPKEKSIHNSLVKTILLSAALVSLYGFLQHPNPLFHNPDGSWRGIDSGRWIQDVQERVFSSLGQPNWLAAYLAMVIPLTWYFLLSPRNKSSISQNSRFKIQDSSFLIPFSSFLLSLLMFWVLLFTKSRAGLAGLGVGLLVFLLLSFWRRRSLFIPKRSYFYFISLVSGCIILLLVSGKPLLGRFGVDLRFSLANKPAETKINSLVGTASFQTAPGSPPAVPDDTAKIRAIVWQGALDIFRHYPIFGSGVETFAYSYWQYRPATHNLTSEWEFLYNKAHNEYLNILATTGLIGLATFALLVGAYLCQTLRSLRKIPDLRPEPIRSELTVEQLRSRDSRYPIPDTRYLLLQLSLLSGFIAGLVANFWGFSVVPVALLFYLYPALSFAAGGDIRPQSLSLNLDRFVKPAKLATLIIFTWGLFSLGRIFGADLFFAQGSQANQIGDPVSAYSALKWAARIRPDEPLYHDNLAFATAILATSSPEATIASQLANESISEIRQALSISLLNVNYWKTSARVFSELAKLDPELYDQALISLDQAQALAPTDPQLPYTRGLVYLQKATLQDTTFVKETADGAVVPQDLVQQTLDSFQTAIDLKYNYREARYALAVVEHELAVSSEGKTQDQKRFDKALDQLKIILETTQPPDFEAGQKLKEWTGE